MIWGYPYFRNPPICMHMWNMNEHDWIQSFTEQLYSIEITVGETQYAMRLDPTSSTVPLGPDPAWSYFWYSSTWELRFLVRPVFKEPGADYHVPGVKPGDSTFLFWGNPCKGLLRGSRGTVCVYCCVFGNSVQEKCQFWRDTYHTWSMFRTTYILDLKFIWGVWK